MSDTALRTLRTILTGTPGFIALKNKNGVYEVVNPPFCQFLGKAPEEIVGKSDAALFPPAENELSAKEEKAVLQAGMPRRCEQQLSGAKGPRWFEITRAPILDDNGDPAGILLTAHDVTEFRQREAAVREAEARIHAAEAQAASLSQAIEAAQTALAAAEEARRKAETQNQALQAALGHAQQEAAAARASAERQLAEAAAEAERARQALAALQQSRAEAQTLALQLLDKLR